MNPKSTDCEADALLILSEVDLLNKLSEVDYAKTLQKDCTTVKFVFKQVCMYVCMYCSYLSSIHEKANCIAIFWTGHPHSLGSCHFRDVWATCFPHKGGGVPLSALPKDTTSELAGLFSTTSHKCRAPSREAVDTIF